MKVSMVYLGKKGRSDKLEVPDQCGLFLHEIVVAVSLGIDAGDFEAELGEHPVERAITGPDERANGPALAFAGEVDHPEHHRAAEPFPPPVEIDAEIDQLDHVTIFDSECRGDW